MTETYGFTSICSKPTSLSLDISPTYIRFIDGGQTIKLDGIEVTAFDVPHDAYGTLAFSITNELGEKLLYLTDCGSPEGIEFEDHDIFIIEANYDNSKLMENLDSGRLHFAVGRRTASGTGHLEINETVEILKNSIGDKTKQIILSHLSDANSDKQLFVSKIKDELGFENVSIAEYGLNINFGENQDFL